MQRQVQEPRVGVEHTSPDCRSVAIPTELSENHEILIQLIANSTLIIIIIILCNYYYYRYLSFFSDIYDYYYYN